ncbi:MAG: hypothetical protein D6690_00095 [Nitrospirae bacterium]|nr:MAG: hypothetical protein D6690_00095 [Nitrospirota bacterium]
MVARFSSINSQTIQSLLDRYYPDRSAGTLIWFALRSPLQVVHHQMLPIDHVPPPGELFRESLPARPQQVLPVRIESTLPFDDQDRHLALSIMFAGEILDVPLLGYARATNSHPPTVCQMPLLDLLWSHIMTRKFLDPSDT